MTAMRTRRHGSLAVRLAAGLALLLAPALLLLPALAAAAPPATPTDVEITGGAQTAARRLPAGQSAFGIATPLRQNAENVLTVAASDDDGRRVTSAPFTVLQLSLTEIVTATISAARLSAAEVHQLVADGVLDLADPENFNVSRFDIVLTVAGRSVPVSVPIVMGAGGVSSGIASAPPLLLGCRPGGEGIELTDTAVFVPCGADGGGRLRIPPVQLIPFVIDASPSEPGIPPIPGVIVIEGAVKTLKELYRVELILANVSTLFTLRDVEAVLELPDGKLAPVVPASGPIQLEDLPPGSESTGRFVIRGDEVGTHTVTAHFAATIAGLGIAAPIPVAGSASTDVEVRGPPLMDVVMTHPPYVIGGEPYDLTVEIRNTDPELPALFTSLMLDVGGSARLLDPSTGAPLGAADVQTLGDVFPGESVSRRYRVLPLATGPITSCTSGASANLSVTVGFVGGEGPACAAGTFPSQTGAAADRPTVVVVPAHNTVDVALDPSVTAIFSAPMLLETITTGFAGASFLLVDDEDRIVPATLELAALGSGTTVATLRTRDVLRPGTTYTVRVAPDVFDTAGRRLLDGVTARFTTAGEPPAPDGEAPSATLTVLPPVSPEAVPRGQRIPVRVDTTDDTGVVRVDLRLDGVFLDTRRPASPVFFLVDTAALAPGSAHHIQAVAFDAAGNTGSAETTVTVAPDTTPPALALVVPESVRRGRPLVADVAASDDGSVDRVELFLDGASAPVASRRFAPFTAAVATTALALGDHRLRAVATDGAGNTAISEAPFTVSADDTPPSLVFVSPLAGASVRRGDRLSVSAAVTDDVAVESVAYFLDGAPVTADPTGFVLDTQALAEGAHTARVVGRDTSGNETERSVEFTVVVLPADVTPPAAPDASRITVSPPAGGLVSVAGAAGAVESGAVVEVLHPASGAIVAVEAADGGFTAQVDAAGDDVLRLVAVDAAGNRSAPTDVVVPAPAMLVGIEVTPASVTLGRAAPAVTLAVRGHYDDGSEADVTALATFTSDAPAIATVTASGRVLPGSNGTTSVRVAVTGPPAVDVPVTVDFPAVVGVEVTPASIHLLDLGRTQQLTVTAVLADGGREPFGGGVGFGSENPGIAAVGSRGLVTGVAEGTTTVNVAPSGFALVAVPVTVEEARLEALVVTPPSLTLTGRGATATLAVVGRFTDGSLRAITGVGLVSNAPDVAAVDAAGVVSAGDDGDAVVTVSAAGVAPVEVPVRVRSLAAIALDPAAVTLIGAGKTRQLTVVRTFTDGSTASGAEGVGFRSGDEAVATVGASGLVTSTGAGATIITAELAGVAPATASVTVEPIAPVGLTTVPASVRLTAAGQMVQLDVFVERNDGSLVPATGPLGFASRDTAVATVGPTGFVTAVANGASIVDVEAEGLAATVPVTVDIPVVTPPPSISAIDRERAGEGDPFVIRGAHFAPLPDENLVLVDGLPALVEAARADELVALVPAGAESGAVQVIVAGQASNTRHLDVYARRAVALELTAGVDLPAAPGETAVFDLADVEVRAGDVAFLSSAPDVPAPVDFDGTLVARVDGGAPIVLTAGTIPELSDALAPGLHVIALELSEAGGRLRSGPLFLLLGPDGSGPIAGELGAISTGESRPMPVTFTDLRYVGGAPVPDGALVAVSAADTQFTQPDGTGAIRSAGGTIIGGVATPNDPRFRTFSVEGGRIDVVYDPAGATLLASRGSSDVRVHVVPADAAGNVAATRAITLRAIDLASFDTASTALSQSAVVADGLAKVVTVTLAGIRDVTGRLVPDGTKLAVSAADTQFTQPDGFGSIRSDGGSIVNGEPTPNDSRFRTFTVEDGRVVVHYDPAPVLLAGNTTAVARVHALPARPDGGLIGTRAFASVAITLSSPRVDPMDVAVLPPSVLADDSNDHRVVVRVAPVTDTAGNPVPDGTLVAASAADTQFTQPDGTGAIRSAGGTITNGTTAANDPRFQVIPVSGGSLEIVYSTLGVALSSRTSATARVHLLPATPAGNVIGTRAFALAGVALTSYQDAAVSTDPASASAVADGFPKTVVVTLSGVTDTAGSLVPDGARVAVSADDTQFTQPDGFGAIRSAGGTITNGTPTPGDPRFKTLEVEGGRVEVHYDPGPVRLSGNETATARVHLLPARPDGSYIGTRAFLAVPITLSSPTAAEADVTIVPPAVLADDSDAHRVIVTVAPVTDVAGTVVPDGTLVGVSAADTQFTQPDGTGAIRSAGGTIVNGAPSPNDGRFRAIPVTGGTLEVVYSTAGVALGARRSDTARVHMVPARPDGGIIGTRAFAAAGVTLAGYLDADIDGPGLLAPGATATYTVSAIVDTAGGTVPDGARIAASVADTGFTQPDGTGGIRSFGGTIVNGEPTPNDGRFRTFTVSGGRIVVEVQATGGGPAVLHLVPARPDGTLIGTRAFTLKTIAFGP